MVTNSQESLSEHNLAFIACGDKYKNYIGGCSIMRNVWKYSIAGQVIFGPDTLTELPSCLKKLKVNKPFIVTDKNIGGSRIGLRIKEVLAGFDYVFWDNGIPEPTTGTAIAAAAVLKEQGCDATIGLGGGSSIDVAKAAAILATFGGNPADYFDENKVPGRTIPIIAIPTTAGTGSEVTPVSVLEDEEMGLKGGITDNNIRPWVAIVDPLLTLSMPPRVTAETGIDALGHAVESYIAVSSKYLPPDKDYIFGGSTELTEVLAEKAIGLIAGNLRLAVFQGQNEEARYNMSLASLIAGMAFGNSGLGLVHAFSFPLAKRTHASHGCLIGLMLPYVVDFNLTACMPKLKRIAELFGESVAGLSAIEAAGRGVAAIKKLQEDIGIATRLREIGIKEEELPAIAAETIKIERLVRGNPRRVTEADLIEILKAAF
ncbi:1,3-propanediol dehydrogenase [Moorella mulderi DSM 14980]|uniref:hydroxyacid-oxoacid transhydrogenase n=2 Tax=Neomoorella TaxID=44260 RepID=A0A151AYT9_9FIRM|nr:1,3-propanediol dehydrogenase [Moorella mulderi DSM 14980]